MSSIRHEAGMGQNKVGNEYSATTACFVWIMERLS